MKDITGFILILIGGFPKCILKGFRTAAHQSWYIFRVVLESNPGRAGYIDFVGLGSILRRREVCANFDELEKN